MPKKDEMVCGHINKHYVNHKGMLEDLRCDLPDGHSGDHHAIGRRKVSDPITDNKGRVVEERYHEEEVDAYWGDAAGVPAKEISEKPLPQLTQFQKDILSDVLKKNPEMKIEEAIEKAKESPIWSAV